MLQRVKIETIDGKDKKVKLWTKRMEIFIRKSRMVGNEIREAKIGE